LLDKKQTVLNLKQVQDPGSLLNQGKSSQGHHIIFTGGCVRSSRTSLTTFLSHEQIAVQNHTIMTANTSLANAKNFIHLGTTNKTKLQALRNYEWIKFWEYPFANKNTNIKYVGL